MRSRIRSLVALVVTVGVIPGVAAAPQNAETDPPVLALPNVDSKPPSPSRIPLLLAVDPKRVRAELSERIPQLLHQESDREVTPGIWVDARVTRGEIGIRMRDDGATGLVPVHLQFDVRSKLGRMTLPIGQCRSTIDVELDIPLKLTSDGKVARPHATTTLREPCRLAGFDVTPFIEREIAQRLAAVEARMSEHLAQADGLLAQLYADLNARLSKTAIGCRRFVPDRLLQLPLTQEQGIVLGRFVVEGMVVDSCQLGPVPSLQVEQRLPPAEFDLAWPWSIALSELQELLNKRLESNGTKSIITTLRSVRRGGNDGLAIFVRASKTQGWVFARPSLDLNAVGLRSVNSSNRDLLGIVRPTFAAVALPVDTVPAERMSQQLLAESIAASTGFGVSPDFLERHQMHAADLRTELELAVDSNAIHVLVHRRQSPAAVGN